MDTPSALKILALAEGASHSAIQKEQADKIASLKEKQASAPTDALKQKFSDMIQKANDAAEFLLSDPEPMQPEAKAQNAQNEQSSTSSRSALSQTKIADLPGMAMADSQQVELQPGTVLLGRYEVKELVGQGGMGAVYRVYDQIRSEDIAIKVLLPSLTKNERALERFLNEAKISSKLSHSNIVNVYDVQKDTAGQDDLYFLTMELLEGQDLRQIMDNQTTVGRPFEIDDIKEYVQGITDGLNHAHEFTVHRDIKPENIWITEEGKVKLMDFGIAQLQSTSQRTQTGAAMGTAYYMAPEQLKGKSDIDGRADQYAVAVLMYELLTGEVPAGMIEPVNEARPDTPTPMVDAIHQALKPKPENRFESMGEFNEQIQSSKGGSGSSKAGNNSIKGTAKKLIILISILIVCIAIGLGMGGIAYGQSKIGMMYEHGYGVTQNYKQAVAWYRKAAKQGNASAQHSLGGMYAHGRGVTKNNEQAVVWYRKAAKQGSAGGQEGLGDAYGYGLGVTKNYKQAVVWYRKAATQGGSTAQNKLGTLYRYGLGVTQDKTQAVAWYRKSAEQGNAQGQKQLGWMYENIQGVARDDKQAAAWYRKAAEQGHRGGELSLGWMYRYGRGVSQDDKQALVWFRKAAEKGSGVGQYNLGLMYAQGRGVERDNIKAVSWYRKSAEQGNSKGRYLLAGMYKKGLGVTKNSQRAQALYAKSLKRLSSRDIFWSQNMLGDAYANGNGVVRDDKKAVSFYRKAAEQNYLRAQVNLGWMYETGRGVAKDLKQAMRLYEQADTYESKIYMAKLKAKIENQ
jgi:TPR repeat protein